MPEYSTAIPWYAGGVVRGLLLPPYASEMQKITYSIAGERADRNPRRHTPIDRKGQDDKQIRAQSERIPVRTETMTRFSHFYFVLVLFHIFILF